MQACNLGLTRRCCACGPRATAEVLTNAELATVPDSKAYLFAVGADPPLSSGAVPRCTAWPVAMFLCDGEPCFAGHLPDDVFADATVMGIHPDYFYECFNLFLNSDAAHALYSPSFTCADPDDSGARIACGAVDYGNRSIFLDDGDMDFSEAQIWAAGIDDEEGWVDMIDSVRRRMNAATKKTGMQAFPTGSLFKFYTQFRWLTDALVVLIAYALLGVFSMVAVLFVAIQPPRPEFKTPLRRFGAALYSAFLLAVVVLVIILTLLAVMGLSGLILNCFTAVTLVVAVGISVEFTAHFLHHYLLHAGSRVERTRETLALVLPPVLDGSITTLLGILPIAAAKYPYIVMYYFFVYLIIVGVGIAFGLVVLPALLASVGWQDAPASPGDKAAAEFTPHGDL